ALIAPRISCVGWGGIEPPRRAARPGYNRVGSPHCPTTPRKPRRFAALRSAVGGISACENHGITVPMHDVAVARFSAAPPEADPRWHESRRATGTFGPSDHLPGRARLGAGTSEVLPWNGSNYFASFTRRCDTPYSPRTSSQVGSTMPTPTP